MDFGQQPDDEQDNQIQQQPRQRYGLSNRIAQGARGMGGMFAGRQDGYNVPGNQPGGQNGQYGGLSQIMPHPQSIARPQMTGGMMGGTGPISSNNQSMPQQSMMRQIAQQPMNRFAASPVGQAINRYRQGQQNTQNASNNSMMNAQMRTMNAQRPQYGASQMQDSEPGQMQPIGTAPGSTGAQPSDSGMQPSSNAALAGHTGPISSSADESSGGGVPMMSRGGIVTKPTLALIGEKEPEAVVPLTHVPDAKVTPGNFMPKRYRPSTGPAMVHGPGLRPMKPMMSDKQSNWKKYDMEHPRV